MSWNFKQVLCENKTEYDYVQDVYKLLSHSGELGDDISDKLCQNIDTTLCAAAFVKEIFASGVKITPDVIKRATIDFAMNKQPHNLHQRVFEDGYVEFEGILGNDILIAKSAKESYGAANFDLAIGEEELLKGAYGVINHLSRNAHSSPFEQGSITFKIRMPIFTHRQQIRHRTARVNEISARYTKLTNEMYMPSRERILSVLKDEHKNDNPDEVFDTVTKLVGEVYDLSYSNYTKLLEYLPAEIARIILPVGVYTEYFWNIDLNNLQKYLTLRCDKHAQFEIRQFANAIFNIALRKFPITLGLWFWNRFVPEQIGTSSWNSVYKPE